MKTWILCLFMLAIAQPSCAQAKRPSLADLSAQTEAIAQPYFDAYIARDWARLEPLLEDHIRFDDATASVVFGAVGKHGKAELGELYLARRSSDRPALGPWPAGVGLRL